MGEAMAEVMAVAIVEMMGEVMGEVATGMMTVATGGKPINHQDGMSLIFMTGRIVVPHCRPVRAPRAIAGPRSGVAS